METTRLKPLAGSHIYNVLVEAVEKAPCRFDFNGMEFETLEGESLDDARARFRRENDFEICTPAESARRAKESSDKMIADQAKAIADAKVSTEAELRASEAPWPKTMEDLTSYINSLVDRPHDYGTCVYAMSLSAVAAFRYVSAKLGTTGFQAGCAEMDILRQTRAFEWGRILDYENLLYPQYCDGEHFPSVDDLMANKEVRAELAKRAKAKLKEFPDSHINVLNHWKQLSKLK